MTTSFIPRVFSRFFPVVFAFAFFLIGKCAQAQIKPSPLRRFLLQGDRNGGKSIQRHIFHTSPEPLSNLFKKTDDVVEENSKAYVMTTWLPGLVPFYRVRHATSEGKEFYTTSEAGVKEAIAKSGYQPGYTAIGYMSPVPTGDTVPLYQLYRSVKPKAKAGEIGFYDDHLYTTSDVEKQDAVKKLGYTYIKIEGYVWPRQVDYTPGGAPVDSAHPSSQYQQAAKMLASVHALYFGTPGTDSKRIDTLIGKLWSSSPEMRQRYTEGLSALEAGKFCRQLLQTDGDERRLLFANVMQEVYGVRVVNLLKTPTSWDKPLINGQASYLIMLAAETKKLNSDPAKRREMIDRAYIRSMGRKAIDREALGKGMQGEQTYWGRAPNASPKS